MPIWEYMRKCIHEAGRSIALAELMTSTGDRSKVLDHLRRAQSWMDRAYDAIEAEAGGRES